MRLLICDDHRLLVDALSMALTQSGYTVVATALDPDGAVAAARVHQPDICLLDVNFRHANGLSAIARIHKVSANTKVIMFPPRSTEAWWWKPSPGELRATSAKRNLLGQSSRRLRWPIGGS